MIKIKPLLTFRTDASPEIGTGHVMRCLALAQAWQDCGGDCIFIMAMDAGLLFQRLIDEGVVIRRIDAEAGSVDDARLTLEILKDVGARFLVVDGYHFSSDYQQTIKKRSGQDINVLVVDDNSDRDHYSADYILNQNIYATDEFYPLSRLEFSSKLLLGPRFCLLRREFLKQKVSNRTVSRSAKKLLITLGGSDPKNITTRILQIICDSDDRDLEVKVIVGSNNRYSKDIKELIAGVTNIKIVQNADDTKMVDAMLWADFAVSAAGSTLWELCRLGVPCLLIIIADNQRMVAKRALDDGITCGSFDIETDAFETLADLIDTIINDQQARELCSRRMRNAVAENGCRNVISKLTAKAVQLHDAQLEDCLQVWQWNNDSFVRKMSFKPQPIAWDAHQNWYRARMIDEASEMYVGTDLFGERIGLVRFQIYDGVADIGVVVAPEFRGKGYGTALISEGTKRCLSKRIDVKSVRALVRSENKASLKAFKNAGFAENHRLNLEGIESVLFTRHHAAIPTP